MARNLFLVLRIALYVFSIAFIIARSCTSSADQVQRVITEAALVYKLDPKLLAAIVQVESGGNPLATGDSHGEVGLMQLHPKYFPTATYDIRINVFLGAEYLAKLQAMKRKKFGCAWFVAYNVGPNRLLKYPELHSYVKKVAKIYPTVCGGRYAKV